MHIWLLSLAAASFTLQADTSTYADLATRQLVGAAQGRHAYTDSLIRDYAATVRTRIDAGFGRSRFARVPPILAHETAAEIHWSLPNNLKVDVQGVRGVSIFPDESIEAEFDRPWFIPRSLGDSIRMVDDELPSTAALHPLAPDAEQFYRYAITDSVTLVVPGRTVRAVAVRVEPKTLGASLIAGDLWIDIESVEVVRMTFVFVGQYNWVAPDSTTPADSANARRANGWAQRIVKLEADLEYALYERLYWMPYRQLVQLTVDVPWFLQLKIPVRFLTTFADYEVNQSVLPRFEVPIEDTVENNSRRRRARRRCPRPDDPSVVDERDCNAETGYSRAGYGEQGGRWEVHYPPQDSLVAFGGWEADLRLDLEPDDEQRVHETIARLGRLEEQLPAPWVGRMTRHFAVERFTDMYRFNRVQGSYVGGGYQIRPGPAFTTLHLVGGFGFSDRRPVGSATWTRDAPGGRLSFTGFRKVREVEAWTSGLGFGNSMNAIFAGHDDADYYLSLGGGISYESHGRGLLRNATFELYFERQRTMATVASSGINDRLGGDGFLLPNRPIAEGDHVRAVIRRQSDIGPFEVAEGVEGLIGDTVRAVRLWTQGALPFELVGRTGRFTFLAAHLVGDQPPQMLYRAGGPATVRGYDYGARMGPSLWSARIDAALDRGGAFSPVVFADAGDVSFERFDPLVAVGGGLSFLTGRLRLNLSKGLSPDRDLRFDLLFAAPR